MTKSTPDPPDYRAAAEETAQSSKNVTEQQTWANRPTINTPFGQQTWDVTPTWDPSTGQYLNSWTQNTYLTPESQNALDSQMRITQGRSNLAEGMIGRTADEYGQPMDWNQFTGLADRPENAQYGDIPDVPEYSPEEIQRTLGVNEYNPVDFQQNLDTSNLQDVDPSQRYNDQAINALNERFDSRMEPRLQRQAEAKRTQLLNQGLKPGDEAYDTAMEEMNQDQGDQRRQADLDAILTGGQEAERYHGMDLGTRQNQFGEREAAGGFSNDASQRQLEQILGIGGQKFNESSTAGAFANSAAGQALQQKLGIGAQKFQQDTARSEIGDSRANNAFNQNMQGAEYQNRLRQEQIAEEMQRRGFTINEMNAILNGQQVNMPNMPGFNAAQASQATNYTGAAQDQYGAEMDAFNAQQQQMQGLMQGGMSAAMMFSDRRLKMDVEPIVRHERNGLMIYAFKYKWDNPKAGARIGYMADEVEQMYPEAVFVSPEGFKVVDYARIP